MPSATSHRLEHPASALTRDALQPVTNGGAAASGSIGRIEFAPGKSLWLWLHLVAAGVVLARGIAIGDALAACLLTLPTLCLGHSVGLHRGIIHRTYRTSRFFQRFLVSLFLLTGLGGPLSWIRLHHVRDYWQNRSDCPRYFAYRHSLLRDFLWNLHFRFVPASWDRYELDPEIESDPFLRFCERTWWIWPILGFALVGGTWGWETALVVGPARVAGGVVGHWFIGFWTHKHGRSRFDIAGATEVGTNSLLLGWISFGEGFHNNHHAHPDSARFGVEPSEFDLGWTMLLALERLGLVRDLRAWSRGNAPRRSQAPGFERALAPLRAVER
ncbi:MAG: fatty acid desaturase [Myxococcota bacterium]